MTIHEIAKKLASMIKKDRSLDLDYLEAQFEKALEIFDREDMFENLQWLMNEGDFISSDYLNNEVDEFSSNNKVYMFKLGGGSFKLGCVDFNSSYFPDGKPYETATLFIDWNEDRVFQDTVSVDRCEYHKSISVGKTAKVLKLKKEWVRSLKKFFVLAKQAVEAHKNYWERKKRDERAAQLSNNIDLGDY